MNIILNQEQQMISDAAVNWFLNSSDTLFQYDGEAGTGKSVVLFDIVNRLHLEPEQILPMAFTGAATIVMRTKGFTNACTCHSGLFTPIQVQAKDPNTGEVIIDKQFNTPVMKWQFIPKDFSCSNIKLIIIDEAWMVPKQFKKFIDRTGIKVIATGDSGQLPPVADEPAYLTSGKIYHLTQLMRQAENSGLIYLAHRARKGLPIDYGLYGNDALVVFDDEVDNTLLNHANIILCAKNETREKLNNRVRNQILSKYGDYPEYGERLICRKNDWNKSIDGISLANGLIGSVVKPPDIGNFNGKELFLDFLPDLLNRPFEDLNVSYQFLNASIQEKEMLKKSPFVKGELLEYAYAITVHLSQGSEYPCGVYFEEYMGPHIQNNLNYTAITRFKQKMVYAKHRPKYWGETKNTF